MYDLVRVVKAVRAFRAVAGEFIISLVIGHFNRPWVETTAGAGVGRVGLPTQGLSYAAAKSE